jgi:hypothetical protein
MRRLAQLLVLAALLLAQGAVVTGLRLFRDGAGPAASAPRQGEEGMATGGVAATPAGCWLHAACGYLASTAAALAASAAFALGLQGLLESGGRRLAAAGLAVLAPAVMGLALGSALSGRVAAMRATVDRGPGGDVDTHAMRLSGALLVALALLAGLAWWAARTPAGDGERRARDTTSPGRAAPRAPSPR